MLCCAAGVPRATFVLSVAVGLLVGLVIGSFATGWYIVPTEVAVATVRTAANEIAEEMVRSGCAMSGFKAAGAALALKDHLVIQTQVLP